MKLVDATVQRVYVADLPRMRGKFGVGFELELKVTEKDYHYDESDQCFPSCEVIWNVVCMTGK